MFFDNKTDIIVECVPPLGIYFVSEVMLPMPIRCRKRRGLALLIIVLVGFLMLSILSAVVINLTSATLRFESWQRERMSARRLDGIARSAANAAAEAILVSADCFGTPLQLAGGVSSNKIIVVDDSDTGIKAAVKLAVQGNPASKLKVTATANEGSASAVVIADVFLTTPPKIVWSAR